MSLAAISFLTAATTALLLYRVLVMLGADSRMIFGWALLSAVAVFTLWAIAKLRAPGGKAG
jgi:hypothetical protein